MPVCSPTSTETNMILYGYYLMKRTVNRDNLAKSQSASNQKTKCVVAEVLEARINELLNFCNHGHVSESKIVPVRVRV